MKLFNLIVKIYLLFFTWLFTDADIFCQTYIFTGATIHTGAGVTYPNGVLAIEKSKIIYAGDSSGFVLRKVINPIVSDCSGKHIWPGIIAPHCKVGLNEIDAARPTRDFAETGIINPNLNSLTAFNSDSKIIPTLRFNGIIYVQSTPAGGIIPGGSSLFKLNDENWEESCLLASDGIHLNWHETRGVWDARFTEDHQQYIKLISDFFDHAFSYQQLLNISQPTDPKTDLKYEAMRRIFSGNAKLYIRVSSLFGIKEAIAFAEKYNIIPVLVGAEDGWKIATLLKEKKVPVILMNIHRLPVSDEEDVNMPYKIPGILQKEGVLFCLGIEGSWEVRNIAFQAGTAAAWGLTSEQALSSITLNTALITGSSNIIGSLESGKEASFVITTGDLLDMKGNITERIFVAGKEMNLQAMQQQLFQNYYQKQSGEKGK